MNESLVGQSIESLGAGYRSGEISPVTVTEALLERIDRLNGPLNAFIVVTRERALAEARAAEGELRAGHDRGPLHGVPYAAKDIFDVKGQPTTAGFQVFVDRIAAEDCTAVRRLAQAGMVLLGKTHCVQFALGAIGSNADYGMPNNPWKATPHIPAGSSSGSAVAVAAGLAPMALGSDTGGSIRMPAALTGTVGLKSSVGRISRAGVYPLSWSFDSVGPIAASVADAALTYQAMQGTDRLDDTTVGIPDQDVMGGLKRDIRGLRIGVTELLFEGADADVAKVVRAAINGLADLGARVEPVDMPELAEALADQDRLVLQLAEACHNNAAVLAEHQDRMDPNVRGFMLRGAEFPAPRYFGAMRRLADRRRRLYDRMRDFDGLAFPACSTTAKPLTEVQSEEGYASVSSRLSRNSGLGNHFNLPGISVPCGFGADGMPIGLMIYGRPFAEDTVLRLAYAFEQATDWHKMKPDLSWAS